MRRSSKLVSLGIAGLLLAGCGGSSDEGGGNAEGFCELAEEADAAGDDVSDALDSGRPKTIERALADAVEAYGAAAEDAPDDIKADVDTMIDAQTELQSVLEKNDFDLEVAFEDPDLQALFEDESIQEASDSVDAYLEDECGIEREDSATDDTAADAGGAVADTVPMTTDAATTDTEAQTETTEAAGSIELQAEVGGTTVGTEDSPSAVYAALLTNTTDQPASNLDINLTMFDAAGTVVGTGTAYVDLILPGQTRAITGTTSITAPAARIEATYSGDVGMPFGTEETDLPTGEFTFEGTQLTGDDYSTGVLGLMKSSYPTDFQNVEVNVVFRGADGSILGGGSTYVGILANGQVGIEPSAYYQIPGVSTFELYGSYSIYELTD